MDPAKCPNCGQRFSRKDAMLRHQKHKHKADNYERKMTFNEAFPPPPPPHKATPPPPPPQGATPPPPPPPPQGLSPPPPPPPPPQGLSPPPLPQKESTPPEEIMTFKHPFTMMISGPTACGKTTFVKNVLQHHTSRIQPSVQRIIWLYKRWQPLYSIIKETVLPRVEFVQGIPTDLADDEYFDPRINNLLILDDLFSEAGKDKRINDLFTEGSHHRSLSVVAINQNLFGTKDPTQRRNCHYLVLFNNPVDRQSVMTLARQMYPGHTDKFMNAFAKATKYPYGYLLVDLKPFTAENDRLKYDLKQKHFYGENVLPEWTNREQGSRETVIKENDMSKLHHSTVGVQTVHIDDQEETMAEKAKPCDDCGLLFDSIHDVQRHVKSGWCPETRETIGEPPEKRRKTEEESDDAMDVDIEENDGFRHLWEIAHKENRDKFNKLYDQYIEDGYNEDDSYEMATERTQPHKEKLFFGNYQRLLEMYWLPLLTNSSHRIIVEQIDKLRQKGISLPSAIKRVIKKHQHQFQDLFELSDDSGDESDDESRQEFKAKRVEDLMRKFDVHYFPTQNETKASTSERAILTIKQKLYRYFTHHDSYNYMSILQDIAKSYNHTFHRTIDMRPDDVKDNNQEEVRLATYFAQSPKGKNLLKLKPFKFKIGDYVRISHLKSAFTRAYDETYSGEVFRVQTRYHRGFLPIYRLKDLQDESIKGTFYESELQKVHVDTEQTWKVEKVLKRRGKRRNLQYFVKWKYFPKKFNSWIPASDME
ncbi:YMD3-like protein [Mya arenaria]|uniref:YMD3-like protein n=1 Tax=Mya arenaria TaxID=6604 RepID=A0ABY7FSY8_MYAAR|nr:YMD3-like protein [Mya arenaria]